ncbi:ribonuclease T2-like protein [Linnemannia elongata]|nr:ribonuclease T2-like protein [Linnemannia elongata]
MIAVSVALTMLSVISAVPWSVSTLSRRQDTCPLNVLSCSLREVDRCCLPEHGLLLLVQQWDITVGPRNKFTMHGIWPDTCHGDKVPVDRKRHKQRDPDWCPGSHSLWQGCDDNRIFFDIERRLKEYPNKANGFMQQMETFWPSNNRNNNCFWSHEWNRHGTCVSNLDPSCKSDPVEGEDIYAFFSKALELRSKYDLYQALAAKGIFPNQGAMVDITRILNAIQAAFNVTPSLSCKNGALNEITLYFKVKNGDQYVPVQPPRSNWRGNCGETVTFPPKNE